MILSWILFVLLMSPMMYAWPGGFGRGHGMQRGSRSGSYRHMGRGYGHHAGSRRTSGRCRWCPYADQDDSDDSSDDDIQWPRRCQNWPHCPWRRDVGPLETDGSSDANSNPVHRRPFSGSGRRIVQSAKTEVKEECINKANSGDCEFFTCIEERFPCGTDGYAIGYGQQYCQRFSDMKEEFDDQGQKWINDTYECLLDTLLDRYVNENVYSCRQLDRHSCRSNAECMVRAGLCDVLDTNKEAIWNVFDTVGTNSWRAWRQIIRAAAACFSEEADEFTRRASEKIGFNPN